MFVQKVTENKHKLNETEIEILRFVLNNRKTINQFTIKEIAKANYVSLNTVVRFAKKLGYDNFIDLKYAVYYSGADFSDQKENYKISNTNKNISLSLMVETEELIDESSLIKIAHDVFLSENCYAFGIGDSEYFAELLSKNIYANGKKITVLNKIYEVENMIAESTATDMIIFISARGETQEVVMMMEKCLEREIQIVAITSNLDSRLSRGVEDKILFKYDHHVSRGVNISDLSGKMYAIMRFVYVFRQLFP